MVHVDLSKAFDEVSRDLLWVGYPQKFVNILQSFHEGMIAQVTTGGQEFRPFKVHTGVRQGCALTWLLYKEAEGNSGVLRYADDCAFVAHTSEALQATLTAAVKACSRLGLTVNTAKMEVQV